MAESDLLSRLEIWASVIGAVIVHLLFPGRLLLNIFLFILCSPSHVRGVSTTILASYVERLELKDDAKKSLVRLALPVGTLLLIRMASMAWKLTKLFVHLMWSYSHLLVAATTAIGLGAQAASRVVPVGWQSSIMRWIQHASEFLPYSLTNVIYLATVGIYRSLSTASAIQKAAAARCGPSAPRFTYSNAPQLDPQTQIRLLKLHRKLPLLQISGELITCTLQDAPQYHAISYVWSHGPQDLRPMTLNGGLFHVKGNVHDILSHCASFSGPTLLWIDSICIDQNNVNEKTHQVRAMRLVYERAAHVLVCLGEGSSNLAFSLISELQGIIETFGNARAGEHMASFFSRRRVDLILRARIEALCDLLHHPWFRRVWVVQEVVMAKSVTFFYDGRLIDWTELYKTFMVLASGPVISMLTMLASDGAVANPESFLGPLSMPHIVAYRMEHRMLGPNSIGHVLRIFGERKATEPIDKVFALIGIAKQDAPLESLIDYRRETDDVLLDLANYLLDTGKLLDVLDLAGIGRSGRSAGLPSWAVDWTMMVAGMPLNSSFAPGHLRYCAATERPQRAVRGESSREIELKGQVIGEICAILPADKLQAADQAAASELMLYRDRAYDLARQFIPAMYSRLEGQTLEEAVWRTLVGDKTTTTRPAPAEYGDAWNTCTRFMQALGEHPPVEKAGIDFFTWVAKGVLSRFGAEAVQEFQEASKKFEELNVLFDSGEGSSPHVFCITDNGYIGMAPALSQVGDTVALIFGSEIPYVLRADTARKPSLQYQLVGDSYVHGIMDGEALCAGKEEVFVLY